MRKLPVTLEKAPTLKPAEDFYRLRREGIGFIEQLSSSQWTNYNTHDPGITVLEVLCYAITDLAYRISWNIKDILASPTYPTDPEQPYPNQPFFTAKAILTVNPVTPDDFRRLLIDLDTVRNAWVFGKACACDLYYYAWCEEEQLILSYQKPPNLSLQSQKVEPLGLYDILLELETDPELGDLNDRKIEHTYAKDEDGKSRLVTLELRFPEWRLGKGDDYKLFLDSTNFHLINVELHEPWRDIFYIDFKIELSPSGKIISIENAALRVYGDTFAKDKTLLKTILTNKALDFIQRYRNKLLKVNQSLKDARALLHDHRNLCEDYCHVKVIDVEDVAVCADVEVAPDADIERVQAEIWIEIEQYFNPPVPFYTLQELMDDGIPVEEIFNGPVLNCGFIKAKELDAAQLKTVLRTSDIINRLMDIEGVIAVNNLQLTKYDSEGHLIKGAADPNWDNGPPVFNAEKISASSLLLVSQWHQPRLYHNQSRFLFYKNGLPFLPRMDEVHDTLIQLRGETERPKIKNAPHDLPIPEGNFRDPDNYTPLQYSFPLTYGIGSDGLPSHASSLRQAQAKQMKAYLMVFEQHLSNAFAQLAHTVDLFSLDLATAHTYFIHELSDALIKGYSDIIDGLNKDGLEGLTETLPEFHERRNRFLDHIMARFGEQFSEYALLLTNLEGRQVALDQLIENKIAFLKAYPDISRNRGKAFNYKTQENSSGIKKRISLLMDYSDLTEQAIVVEHLLLRPKFPGDALYLACTEGNCKTCGDEDPYSFRLTFVMPAPSDNNLDARDFAERTIRQETPSHLLVKICWVDNDSFNQFEDAWHQWLAVNASFDWTDERLLERVQAILEQYLDTELTVEKSITDELCQCATTILTQYGMDFYNQMDKHLKKGDTLESFTVFSPDWVTLCSSFTFKSNKVEELFEKEEPLKKIEKLLKDRYEAYKEVSYRLSVLLNLLSELRNTYPSATLHDCDEGNDRNPVRLGKTALGNASKAGQSGATVNYPRAKDS
jgi:hypothetical protein